MERIREILEEGVAGGGIPGAVAAVIKEHDVSTVVVGNRSVMPEIERMTEDTIFDLASLTKVVATTTAMLLLIESGQLTLDDEVSDLMPDFRRCGVTVRHLVTHTSGLPAWRPIYSELDQPEKVVSYLSDLPPVCEPGTKVIYSCLGYILLGRLLETVSGISLDRLVSDMIFSKLGMTDTMFCPPANLALRCAPTESKQSIDIRRPGYSRTTIRQPGSVIRGEVHDENCYFLGGVAGNAGLFSTARDLAMFALALFSGELLSRESIELLSRCNTVGLNESRSVGWSVLEDGSLYHTGFTGTSMRINLRRRMAGILLTNRVHPDSSRPGIAEIRTKFHEEVFGQ